jgi:short-subunit dehydrogenase
MSSETQKNPAVLISGCTKGIGLAIAEIFAANGFNVAGCARNTQQLSELFVRFSTQYPKQQFLFETCDAANTQELKAFAADALEDFGSIEVLINNAGTFEPGSILEEPEGQFEKLMLVNLTSAYHLTRAIVPSMVQHKKGHVINICSVASIKAYPNGGSYSISKFGLYGLNQTLREEVKEHKVRVTAILPGATFTQSWEGAGLPEERFMSTQDLAKIVWNCYELSDRTNVEQIIVRPILGDI